MEPAVATEGLQKRYGRSWAVRGVDLVVEAGQIYGLLGPNGAGKSTTMRMLLGLIRPTAGHVRLFGRSIGLDGVTEPGLVGALVEAPALWEYLSGYRNLAMVAGLSGAVSAAELEWALRRVRLWGRHRDRVKTYSHGMRQRLAIAQTLVPRPRLLVLDEPAGGLDPEGLIEVRDLLRELAADGVTIMLSSHLLHEVEQTCTHVGIIARGELLASGRVDELLGAEERYQVQVTDEQAAERVLSSLAAVREHQRVGEREYAVWLAEGGPEALNAELVRAGVGVRGLARRHTALEDIYMELAGASRASAEAIGSAMQELPANLEGGPE
ncbi:MAG: ABC transporter ATP-binding protein [candidate division WS1 bacterium]|jgi:ABC-2 type transport system ATP-binding protein|nr:ABC transporter ATP-binding protein [candidate division WS1 bacterium]